MKKYRNFLKTQTYEFFRDFSGLGNVLIILIFYLLVVEQSLLKRASLGLVITLAICYFIKLIFHKDRPDKEDFTNLLEKIESGSFPSVHSASIMYSGLVIIKSVDSLLIDTIFILIIMLVGYSRHFLKKHYFKDILAGYAIGLLIFLSLFVFYLI
ncbi:phosphatase PAP2 family protein [Candidatus Woesearchaeota archaeon]|nr:phosphatase PAP2 family protein [Candidatus Woesearchaeota archaeon]